MHHPWEALNSDGGTASGNGKLQVAVVLRLGNLIAYSSSKIRFLGLMPFSLVCSTVILISCSRTASSSKRVTVCLGGSYISSVTSRRVCLAAPNSSHHWESQVIGFGFEFELKFE